MSNQRYTPEFKDEAARKIVDRGYSVADVSERLGVSAHSLYKLVKAVKPDKSEEQAAALIEACSEVLKLRAQLKRTEEERDILKRPPGTLLRNPSKVPIFFFNDTATPEIYTLSYTLSLHDALPI